MRARRARRAVWVALLPRTTFRLFCESNVTAPRGFSADDIEVSLLRSSAPPQCPCRSLTHSLSHDGKKIKNTRNVNRPAANVGIDEGEPWDPKEFPLAYGTCMNYAMKLGLPSEPYLKSIMVRACVRACVRARACEARR